MQEKAQAPIIQSLDDRGQLVVDESQANRLRIPKGTRVLVFENPSGAEIARSPSLQALRNQNACDGVVCLEIGWNSRMTSLWVADAFPNIEEIRLRGRKIASLDDLRRVTKLRYLDVDTGRSVRRSLAPLLDLSLDTLVLTIRKDEDVDVVARCGYLKTLALVSWKLPDLRRLSCLKLRRLVLRLGVLETTAGADDEHLEELRLVLCTKFQTLTALRVTRCYIDACNRLDVDTVGCLRGVRDLTLCSLRALHSFAFLRKLEKLEQLVITATRIKTTDFAPIIESRSLRRVFLAMIPDVCVAELGRDNPTLDVSNGNVHFRDGKQYDPFIAKEDGWS